MKHVASFFLILLGVCLIGFSAHSEITNTSYDVTQADQLYELTQTSQLFIDSTATLSFEQVKQLPFQAFSTQLLKKAHWQQVLWIKISINNRMTTASQWLLHTGKASFADVYIRQPDGSFVQKKSGYYRKNSERDEVRGKENSVHIQLLPGITEVYVRYQNALKIAVAPRLLLQPTDSWNEYIIERNLYEGIAQGVLLILFLYNILLYFILKRNTYLYYSFYILALAIFYLNVYNLGKETFLGEVPRVLDYNWVALQLVVIFLLLFIANFLDTPKRFPNKHKNIRILIVANLIWGVIGVLYLTFSKDLGTIFIIHKYFNLVQFSNILLLLVLFWTSKIKIARLLVIGTMPMFLGGVWDVLFRNASDVTRVHINYFQVGAIVQLVLFSLSIGYKMKVEERKRRKAQEKLIEQLQENQQLKDKITVALEKKVRERTHALVKANEDLSLLNREKTRLISIIAHDLNSPLNALKGLLNIFENDLLGEEELKKLVPEVTKDVNYIANLFNNLLVWARSQMEGTVLQPKQINLKAITEETIQVLSSQSRKKNLDVQNLVPGTAVAFADEEMIKLVIRNLISNAIKFTPENGKITVDTAKDETAVTIRVTDTGKGISNENLQKLFNNELFTLRGTHNEKGSGLGLILCKDFVEQNSGKIWVETQPGSGSRFIFSLPVPVLAQAKAQPTEKVS